MIAYPTVIGTMELETNWAALEVAAQRRCGWPTPPDRTFRVEVQVVPKDRMPEMPEDGWWPFGDVQIHSERDLIQVVMPEPCYGAGAVLEWVWHAIPRFCRPEGWEFLHAAAAVKDGKAVLICGRAGSGKTTALLEFLSHGLEFLSDDAVLLAPDGTLYAWTNDLHLTVEQVREGWPALVPSFVDLVGKARFSPQELGFAAAATGVLSRVVVLADEDAEVTLVHAGVRMQDNESTVRVAADLTKFAPVEHWGERPRDLHIRLDGEYEIVPPDLAVCTPFSGKGYLLARWVEAWLALHLPTTAHVRWLCNSPDDAFWAALCEQADRVRKSYPDTVIWRDTSRVGLKDRQVAYLWQQLRSRVPESCEAVFAYEDDVLPDPEAWKSLLDVWAGRQGKDIVGIPVPHTYQFGETTSLAWDYAATSLGVQCAPNVRVMEARPGTGPALVGGISFSCTLIPAGVFRQATLSHGYDNYPASGYDHLFCHEAAAMSTAVVSATEYMHEPPRSPHVKIVALWNVQAVHVKDGIDVRSQKRRVLVLGGGHDIADGPTWTVCAREPADEVGERIAAHPEADYVLVTDPGVRLPAGYVDAGIEHFCWNYAFGAVWGYRASSDGRMSYGAGPGVLLRASACRGARGGTLEEVRAHLAREGWRQGHHDRAYYTVLDSGLASEGYIQMTDPVHDRAPYRVCMLNRDPYRGGHPGFGGDIVQIAGYRSGLRNLGIPVDLRPSNFGELEGYQLVHLNHVQFPWAWQQAGWCDGHLPVVLSAITHGRPSQDMIDPVVSKANHIVCYSRTEAAFYAERYPEKHMHVVPMGVWPELFRRQDVEVEPEARVLMAGKYCDHKNQLTVLEACEKLDVPVTFCGFNEDPHYDAYPDQLREAAGQYAGATVLGKLTGEELWNAYRRSYVHVCATRFEPFGQVTLDALALGCNIVHTQHSWAAEQFGKVGSLCDPLSVDSVAAAIDTELRRTRGWARLRPPTWTEAAKGMLAVYEEALAR